MNIRAFNGAGKFSDRQVLAINVDPDLTAPRVAIFWVSKFLEFLRYVDVHQLVLNSLDAHLLTLLPLQTNLMHTLTVLFLFLDVDVKEPDEKSIITYVSSLYDVFPEVPTVEQSLMDNERQLKIDEYRDLSSSLVTWLQDVIMMMSQRNFPSTLIEMKSLLADLNRFKIEDVPPRLEMRKKALRVFDETQVYLTLLTIRKICKENVNAASIHNFPGRVLYDNHNSLLILFW